MRTAVLFTAAFAAAVLASPLEVRDEVIVTATDVDYVTAVVTVTAGQEPAAAPATPAAVQPAASSPAAAPAPAYQGGGWWRKHHHSKRPRPSYSAPAPAPVPSSSPAGYPTVAPVPSSYPAPAPVPSSYPAPAPVPSSEPAPPPAPAPSSTYAPPAPAPSSSSAPAPAPTGGDGTVLPAPPPASAAGAKYAAATWATQLPVATAVAVNHHNIHRANYSSPDLAWDDDLFNSAAIVASSCTFGHQTDISGGGYGQNIAAGGSVGGDSPTYPQLSMGSVVSDQWFNSEVAAYIAAGGGSPSGPDTTPAVFEGYGHLTQVIWAATNKVGCATVHCPKGVWKTDDTTGAQTTINNDLQYYTVCNYSPAGNMGGEYVANLGTCKDQPTVDGSATL